MKKLKHLLIGMLLALTLSGCMAGANETKNTSDQDQPVTLDPSIPPSQTPVPSSTATPTPTFTPTVTPVVVLDPEPIQIQFLTEDGVELTGMYFPADENPAPIIVLMNWARGDQTEWGEIALWLQDRGKLERKPEYNHTWKSSSWYPENSIEGPLGVFTFNFRDCTGTCQAYLPADWLLDAQAAIRTAAGLQGADPYKILTTGASIGADGAVDACAWINQTDLGKCLGSFGLSPASLLTVSFEEAAGQLLSQQPTLPVYCLIGLRDDASVETCTDVPGLTLVDYGYIENHGMELIQPNQIPDPLDLLQEFIKTSLIKE